MCARAEFWRAAVFFSGSFWAPTRDNVVARLGVRSVFAFMFHPFYVPVVKTAVRALQRNAPRVDDLAWLPVIIAFQVFVSRQPLLSLDGVVTPFKAWLAAPRGAPDLGQRRAALRPWPARWAAARAARAPSWASPGSWA